MAQPLAMLATFLLLAVLGPAQWWLSRPGDDAGPPLAAVLGSAAGGGADGPAAPGPGSGELPGSAAWAPVSRAGAGAVQSVGTGGSPRTPSVGSSPRARPAATPRSVAPPRPGVPPRPVRLRLPGLGVTAPVDAVGVARDGSMALPADPRRVGWYRFGAAPGSASGNTVIAGHVDTREQGPGAFFDLRLLSVGDPVEVVRQDGSTVRYRVVARQTVLKRRLPTTQLFAVDGAPRLVLITCGGPFLPELGSYTDNLVVVAEPTP